MKAIKPYSIVLVVIMLSQQSTAQLANFYSSPGYSSFVNNMISNSIWKSAMDSYTKEYKGGSNVSNADTSYNSTPEVIPEYRQFRAVQFKPTGTRLTLQEYELFEI